MKNFVLGVTPQARSNVSSGHRVCELDGLRAFAILPVMLHHCCPKGLGYLTVLAGVGWVGVDLFFVLSGYLITGILLDTVGSLHYYRNFIVRRTIRIFPLYYLSLALITLGARVDPTHWSALQSWGGAKWFLFYIGNFRAALRNLLPPVFPFATLWSLQVEEQYYLLFPLVVAWLSPANLRRVLIGCLVFAPLLRCYLAFFVPKSGMACYTLMPCRMDTLAMGGLVAILVRSQPSVSITLGRMRLAAIVGALSAVACIHYGASYEDLVMRTVGFSILGATFASVLCVIVLSKQGSFSSVLCRRPLVYTGQIAYGLYLLHVPAAGVVRGVLGLLLHRHLEPFSLPAIPILFISSYISASLSWRYFESPILRLKDRFTYRG